MFGIELSAMFYLCFIACRAAIFDAAVDICTSVDVVVKVMGEGFIDLLVAVDAPTSLGAWLAGVVV